MRIVKIHTSQMTLAVYYTILSSKPAEAFTIQYHGEVGTFCMIAWVLEMCLSLPVCYSGFVKNLKC